jgi:hypothetical protein
MINFQVVGREHDFPGVFQAQALPKAGDWLSHDGFYFKVAHIEFSIAIDGSGITVHVSQACECLPSTYLDNPPVPQDED